LKHKTELFDFSKAELKYIHRIEILKELNTHNLVKIVWESSSFAKGLVS